MYPFATFESLDKQNIYSLCLKYVTLKMRTLQKTDTKYYICFENLSVEVSKEVYEDVENLMIECNRKFDRANLGSFSPATG